MRHPSLRDKSSWGLCRRVWDQSSGSIRNVDWKPESWSSLLSPHLQGLSDLSDVGGLNGGHVFNKLYDNDLDVKRIIAEHMNPKGVQHSDDRAY